MEIFVGILILVAVAYAVWQKFNSSSTVKVSAPAPSKPRRPVAKAKSVEVPSVTELKSMTKQQLVEFAGKNSIKVVKSGTKADIIRTISSSQK